MGIAGRHNYGPCGTRHEIRKSAPTGRWYNRGTRGKTPGKGYASGMGASGILLKTLTSICVHTPPSGELPGVLRAPGGRGLSVEEGSTQRVVG